MVDQPSAVHNPVSIFGAWLTTLAAFAFIAYFIVDSFGWLASPYAGLFGFIAVPALFILGLVLIPIGMWRESRRRRRGRAPWVWPTFDLRIARTRQVVLGVAVLTLINLTIVTIAGLGAVHYSESTEFCGQVCHTPMKPQFTAHLSPPHANITCVQCHVGPGTSGFVKAKMAGSRQLWGVITGKYSHPIPSPEDRMPRAVDTCMQCHTPGHPDRDVARTIRSYADDAPSTESATALTMHVGSIHWHARPGVVVEYAVSPADRDVVPYVRVTDQGKVTEYFADGVSAAPATGVKTMDCIDCHSRPAHTFSASADRAVNAAIGAGEVSRSLPFVHKEMVAALTVEYPDEAAARAAIAKRLSDTYHSADGEARKAIAATQKLYSNNVFPEMKVTWGTYITNLGHADRPGCFRCHDDGHKTKDGRAIRQDCTLCHKVD